MRWLGLVLVGLIALLAYLLATREALTAAPAVKAYGALTPADLERGRHRQLFPPQGQLPARRHIVLSEREVNLALNYALAPQGLGRAIVQLDEGSAQAVFSLWLPALGRYLNLYSAWTTSGPELQLDHLAVGRQRVPRLLVDVSRQVFFGWLAADTVYAAAWRLAHDSLREIQLRRGMVSLVLDWDAEAVKTVADTARGEIAKVAPAQIAAYREHLSRLAARRPAPDFAAIVGELFALARERTPGIDAVSENRALLVVLAEAVTGRRLGLPGVALPQLDGLDIAGRVDYAQHFALSAAIAAVADQATADYAGLLKEVRDTRGGSGFSFSDLAADRAGSRLGALATASEASARRVQALLAGSRDTALYLPRLDDLPEFLSRAEFERRYGGVGGEGYRRVAAEIERRIDMLPFFRAMR